MHFDGDSDPASVSQLLAAVANVYSALTGGEDELVITDGMIPSASEVLQ